ncbi:CD48 antigen-like isoform X2 [Talpa occidentalis]|uniref:CD48 antigen-like isoform X2 n=1 Tax=Talpa occidentalis TaxID=50954 RepID=UPI00188F10D7|nr:CD48 antigen-like isoform X2 [Talpa occidentalis]
MDSSRSSSWFPTQTLVLLLCSQTAEDPSFPSTLEKAVGESVQLPLNCSSCPDIREIEWTWGHGDKEGQFLVSWRPNTSAPEWYKIEEKYKSRLFLTEMGFLTITDLTTEMSGIYTAKTKFHSGASQKKAFRLCVYEPVPHPQILIHSSAHTSGWCKVSLECGVPGVTEHLTVAWESQDLPWELEQSGPLGLAPKPWNLSLTLLLNQTNTSLTCVVSNPVDRKNVTLHLDSICLPGGSVQRKWIWSSILPMVLMLMLILGAGVWVWVRMKRKTGKRASWAAAPQALPPGEPAELPEYDVYSNAEAKYSKVSPLRQPQKDLQKDTCRARSPRDSTAVCTVYEKIRASPEPQGSP